MNVSDIIKQLYKPQENALKVISLGWGVQSFTLAAMVALGELPPVDFVIHADTTHESSWTYAFAEKATPWLEAHGVKVVTVQPAETKNRAFDDYGGVFIPAYTFSSKGNAQLNRQCTGDWKIAPMRRYFQKVRNGRPIEMWLGITTDEIQRAKTSDVKYIQNRFPLIEKNMSRFDCVAWLTAHNLEVPKRSSCTFCPYHNTENWKLIMSSEPDRKEAIEHDRAIRKVRPPFDLFIHPARVPIDEIDFRTAEEKGQLSLWDNECDGICGV
ncbi:MAG TPA: hypothetical protein PKJ68_06025 [Candidatus Woesebacteria bacterium]|nr:hypothetical protein [Candidatus Woesebacteria bacterium]